MELIFENTEKNITEKDLIFFQDKYKFKLSNEYKNHLLKYNGGRCSPNIIDLTKDGKVFDSTDIDWFLAIYEGEYDSLEEYFINFSINNESFPNSWLPIAHDSGGNLFCLEEKTSY